MLNLLFQAKKRRSGYRRFHGICPVDPYPTQFVKDKFIFIHIPKCAGSSFLNSYLGYQLGHAPISTYYEANPRPFSTSFSCAFVRNPIARFVSAYNHIHTCDLWPQLIEAAKLLRSRSLSLSDLAEKIHLYPDISSLKWFKSQFEYLVIDEKVAVTRVFKTEYYDEALRWMASNTGIRLHCLDAPINRRSKKGLKHGPQELTPKAIASLRQFYFRDFTLFGYY